jgi:excisionase family DNA binding protein
MIAARSCRGVVVLGTATTEIECVLRRLGLAPLDDDSEKATLWLRAEETMSSRSKAEADETALRGPLLLSIGQVSEALGVGRTMVYDMISRGQLEVVHLGRAARVPANAVDQLVRHLCEGAHDCSVRSVGRARLQPAGSSDRSQRRAAP